MLTKKGFDAVLMVLVGFNLAKGLFKASLARHAANDTGLAGSAAQAGLLAVS